jgi:hypothetical protein
MKLVIVDQYGKSKTFTDPMIVPRVGDQVNWFYSPAPHVTVVNINYESQEVVVVVGNAN